MPGSPPRHLKTKPIDDDGLRRALEEELRKEGRASLLVVAGIDVGTRVALGAAVEIGRDPSCSLPLRDEGVSWRHLRIEPRVGPVVRTTEGNARHLLAGASMTTWVALDLGSTNGTMRNGEKCTSATLAAGDRLFLGKTILEFQIEDAIREGYNAKVEKLLHEDELSGLLVKRRFEAQLETTAGAIAAGTIARASILVLDMDGVKAINDANGHDFGAYVIGETGRVIGRVVSEARLPGGMKAFATRFGGDEFAAALPGATKDEACAVGEAIRGAVASHAYEFRGVALHPGISVGVATLPDDGATPTEVFQVADEAMYRAKRAGKNRVAT